MVTIPPTTPPTSTPISDKVQPAQSGAATHRHVAGESVDTSPQGKTSTNTNTNAQTAQQQANAHTTARAPVGQTVNQPVSLSASMANLSSGAQILATASGQTPEGLTVLQTPNGTLVGSIVPPPAKGTELLLRVMNVDNGVQAKLVSVGGQPPTGTSTVQLALTTVTGQNMPTATQAQNMGALIGQTITGQLHPPAASSATPPQSILLTVLGFQAPQGGPAQAGHPMMQTAGALPPGTQAAGQLPPQAGQSPAQGTMQGQPGTAANAANTTAAQTPATTGAAQAGAPQATSALITGQSIQGTITSHNNGILTVQTNAGTISMPAPQNPPPVGSTVQLSTPQAVGPYSASARLAALSNVTQLGTLETLGQKWPALDEALQTLQSLNPAAAQTMINTMPSAGPKLGENMLMYLMTLGRGSTRQLIGEEGVRTLEQAGRQQLLQQLTDDIGQLSRLASDTAHQDWRSVIFPFYDGSSMQQIQMYVERQKKRKNPNTPQEGVRFIIALEFSEIGDMQLDGRIHEDFRVVELALRSHEDLTDQIKEDVGDIFRNHLDAVSWSGTLTFVVNDVFPLKPMEEMLGTHSSDYVPGTTLAPAYIDNIEGKADND